jgi:hypothetical protein
MFQASGRNLAVAAAFLSNAACEEGKVAFLCCRALDAHEDLNADRETAAQRVAETADYLLGRSAGVPTVPTSRGCRESDQLEFLLASRLPWLKQAVGELPATRRLRVETLIDDVARAMTAHARARRNGAAMETYGSQVLGRVVRYSFELIGIRLTPTVDPEPIGRLCQSINDLRDLEFEESAARGDASSDREVIRSSLWLELAETAAIATSVLRELPFGEATDGKAALVYMAVTTLKAVAREAGFPLPRLARHPVSAALSVSSEHSAYRRILQEIDGIVLGIMIQRARYLAGAADLPPATNTLPDDSRQTEFEAGLADQHPDPKVAVTLKRSCQLFRWSVLLTRNLPAEPLSHRSAGNEDGTLLMLSDYLMAAAVIGLEEIGLPVLAAFCRSCSELIDGLQIHPDQTDPNGLLAVFLTEATGNARGLARTEIERQCRENQASSRALHRHDRNGSIPRRPIPESRMFDPWSNFHS